MTLMAWLSRRKFHENIVNQLHEFGECRSFVVDRDDVVLRFGRRSSEPPSSWARYVKMRRMRRRRLIGKKEGRIRTHNRVKEEAMPSLSLDFIASLMDYTPTSSIDNGLVDFASDGVVALVLVSGEKARELGLHVIAKIKGYGDATKAPELFTTASALATTSGCFSILIPHITMP
ncbi:hypothetical protein ACSQ67_025040 [Phaseolus vulgaris]